VVWGDQILSRIDVVAIRADEALEKLNAAEHALDKPLQECLGPIYRRRRSNGFDLAGLGVITRSERERQSCAAENLPYLSR
jgi:hypothetical protein